MKGRNQMFVNFGPEWSLSKFMKRAQVAMV